MEKTLDTIAMMGFTEIEGGGGRIAPEDLKDFAMTEESVFHPRVRVMNNL